ncbi:MAG: ribbon-helix-helix domain-containing protein [Candidatus Pacebacteria bacterium]|nr:ribbon-helix-helix domain-containing protein [Candidatus Paceibacterota bacterium]
MSTNDQIKTNLRLPASELKEIENYAKKLHFASLSEAVRVLIARRLITDSNIEIPHYQKTEILQKKITFTEEQWNAITEYQHNRRINSRNEAIRLLILEGLEIEKINLQLKSFSD